VINPSRMIELRNARLFDGVSDECPEGMSVLVSTPGVDKVFGHTPHTDPYGGYSAYMIEED